MFKVSITGKVSAELRDGNGQRLASDARQKAETLKTQRSQNNLDNRVSAQKKIADSQKSVYQATVTQGIQAGAGKSAQPLLTGVPQGIDHGQRYYHRPVTHWKP